ncbi:glycoside hydrolase family 2 TIM barrel-domain containing protein [Paenibacillus chondroitinus]|uniref:Glycoside hydrolase family 2 TIM barrel-domain containing protein n=1 Tax=Paenibacillus chondroitinus TaxID=59842 RepID=A0ABU6DDP6_9BACL|nr:MULTISPECIES: sugar-binding domain-containing protein [Paenibacillus]MCY9663014.1 glycoside hydrolase family 2 [Paenibacillus anseongense]MEB4795867.1 glycoside hydrolase family 2 TIM barrel-domain containing protein [Paenibacillus chondroitinus]
MTNQPRADYPRPQFVRDSWMNLNGEWEFEFDDDRVGSKEKWHLGNKALSKRIQVPFAFQSKLSGIGSNEFHDVVWYRRDLAIPDSFANKRILLHFGAVDYEASVWVNGTLVATHEGGHTPFHADITDALQPGTNKLVVKAVDYSTDVTLPRGKQYWLSDSASIFYTRTTGIWQTVWMEAVSADAYLDKVRITPDIDNKQVELQFFIEAAKAHEKQQVKVEISFKGKLVSEDTYLLKDSVGTRAVRLNDFNDHGLGGWWTPERPNLYDVKFTLLVDEQPVDQVTSYFGMRKVSIENGKLCLNNRPYFLKMVLDQGYFPDGNLTPPSDEAIKQDVELTKAMGFNGARKHQKLEDPRYLYWCDQLGLVVWSEAANAYEYTEKYVERFTKEWQASVDRDYNHPSIIAWVPLNESWGVPNIQIDKRQQQHALTMYHLTKSIDSMRPVISNDGWELVKTDLFAIHDYEWREEVLTERYSTKEKAVHAMPANRRLFVEGFPYENQPILVTEFGGIAYKKSEWEGWGYSGAENDEDYEQKLRAVIRPLLNSGVVQGYCYTQLTDVEQEINGLLTYDRKPKIPVELIKAINDRK